MVAPSSRDRAAKAPDSQQRGVHTGAPCSARHGHLDKDSALIAFFICYLFYFRVWLKTDQRVKFPSIEEEG